MGAEDPVDTGRPTAAAADPTKVRAAMKQPTSGLKSPAMPAPAAPSPDSGSDFARGADYLLHPKKRTQDIDKAVDDAS